MHFLTHSLANPAGEHDTGCRTTLQTFELKTTFGPNLTFMTLFGARLTTIYKAPSSKDLMAHRWQRAAM